MRSPLKAKLRRVKAKVQTGDRAGALAELDALLAPPPQQHPHDPPEQLLLHVILFECRRFHRTMPIDECLNRRGRVYPSGGEAGKRGGPKGRPVSLECVDCPLGKANAYACPGVTLRPSTRPPEVLPLSQRLAKRARALVTPDDHGSMDPMTEASLCSRDDETDWKG